MPPWRHEPWPSRGGSLPAWTAMECEEAHMGPRDSLNRWRLVLGPDAEQGLGYSLEGVDAQRDRALGFLYNREYGAGRNVRLRQGAGGKSAGPRQGGLEDSQLSVPEWI